MTVFPTWPLSAFLTSLPLDFAGAVRVAAELGFTHVDPVALAERPADHLDALAAAGVVVSCTPLGRDLPEGLALDADDVGLRRTALEHVRRQVIDAAQLGATCAYLVPPTRSEPKALGYFAEACGLLAQFAARRMVRLCVEPVPGRALAHAGRTLDWLDQFGAAGPGLLLDIGHCLISGEDAAAVVRHAGPRLAYVHLDDNDGVGDLHWPLLTGRLTEAHLCELSLALKEVGYRGTVALELNARNADPVQALAASKAAAERCLMRS
jgi:sugar phosphate isomerase/epimerase